jgi:signal transduction histidine kinase
MTPSVRKKKLKLVVRMDVASPMHSGDALRFRQIVFNLLSNAIKFTPKGGEVTVAVTNSESDRDLVRVDIQDTGIGITEDHLPNLFEVRHYRGSSAEWLRCDLTGA